MSKIPRIPTCEPMCPDMKVLDGQKASGTYGGRKAYKSMYRRENSKKIAARHGWVARGFATAPSGVSVKGSGTPSHVHHSSLKACYRGAEDLSAVFCTFGFPRFGQEKSSFLISTPPCARSLWIRPSAPTRTAAGVALQSYISPTSKFL